jgi:hypothetical protein
MEKILKFIDHYAIRIALFILVLLFFRSCVTNSKIERLEEYNRIKMDSIDHKIYLMEKKIYKEIKIEGLRSERRMIDATDRKILDVNRQAEIDKTIKELEQ